MEIFTADEIQDGKHLPVQTEETQAPAVETPAAEAPEAAPSQQENPAAIVPEVIPVVTAAPPDTPAPALVEPEDPFKALGLEKNEFNQKLIDAAKNGKVKEFFEVMGTDYSAIPDEALLKMKLREDYPEMSEKNLDRKLKEELADKYKIGGFDEEDEEYGRDLLKNELRSYRDGKIAAQQAYQVPAPPPSQQSDIEQQIAQQREAAQRDAEILKAHPDLVAFETNRVIKIGGEGDDAFNYEVDPSLDVKATVDNLNPFFDLFYESNAQGEVKFNMNKWIRTLAYASNMDKYDAMLLQHGKTLGAKAEFDGLRNPAVEQTSVTTSTPGTVKYHGIVDRDKI